jgi:hypothetical protein
MQVYRGVVSCTTFERKRISEAPSLRTDKPTQDAAKELRHKLVEPIDKIKKQTARFSKRKPYGLLSQMQGSAIAMPSHTAEGHSRSHSRKSDWSKAHV